MVVVYYSKYTIIRFRLARDSLGRLLHDSAVFFRRARDFGSLQMPASFQFPAAPYRYFVVAAEPRSARAQSKQPSDAPTVQVLYYTVPVLL